MGSPVDVAVVGLRGIVFVAVLQAAGAALFRLTSPALPKRLDTFCRRLILVVCTLAALGVLARSMLEPARMAGSLAGMFDPFLWTLFLGSDVATAQAFRLAGIACLVIATLCEVKVSRIGQWIGVGLMLASFVTMGHTSTHSSSLLLGGLLAMHIGAAAYWFGALMPLLAVLQRTDPDESVRVFEVFSRLAVRIVPVLFLAGLLLASVLLASVAGLAMPYGRLILLKLVLFLLLLGLAAANRYRWVPHLRAVGRRAWLQRSIAVELVLMVGVLFVTAAMTTLYSPH
jgi:putative copper resistance protein D